MQISTKKVGEAPRLSHFVLFQAIGDDVVAGMKEDATQYQTSFLPKSGANGVLWFTIAEHYGTYYIMRFYENLDNQ